MEIGIEVNGVLRDTIGKIKITYEKYYSQPVELEGAEEDTFEYKIIEPIDSLDISKHFTFPDKDSIYDFLYVQHPMDVFGYANCVENSSIRDLNDIYYDFRDNHNLKIVSDEIGKSKPATLYFLSRYGCLLEEVLFYSEQTLENIWGKVDVLVTANPNILANHPKDKIIVKYETFYNKEVKSKLSITELKELHNIIKNLQNG